jgi:hypothetical protein
LRNGVSAGGHGVCSGARNKEAWGRHGL